MLSPVIKGAILCDDVRTEFNGKHIVIGVYGPEIGVQDLPGPVRFNIAVLVDIPVGGDYKFKLRILNQSDVVHMEATLDVSTLNGGKNILVPGLEIGLIVQEPGLLILQAFWEEWVEIGRWDLSKMEADEIPLSPHDPRS